MDCGQAGMEGSNGGVRKVRVSKEIERKTTKIKGYFFYSIEAQYSRIILKYMHI